MRRRGEAGFTLVEVLVALAIATLLAATLYRGLGVGWRALRIADREALAVDVARARLASVGVETPLVEGRRAGVAAGDIRWSETISPHGLDENGFAPRDGGPQLYQVTVEVRWSDGSGGAERQFSLMTLKLRDGE